MKESKIKQVQKEYGHITPEKAVKMFIERTDDAFFEHVAREAGITAGKHYPVWDGYMIIVNSPKLQVQER